MTEFSSEDEQHKREIPYDPIFDNCVWDGKMMVPVKKQSNLEKCLTINNIPITVDNKGYINLTELCHSGDRLYKNWKRLESTDEFLNALSESQKIPIDKLIYQKGGNNQERATYGHPQVAIDIAYWISPEFRTKVTKWVFELGLYGKVELGNEKTNSELLEKWLLKCEELRLENQKIYGKLDKKQSIINNAINTLYKKDKQIEILKRQKEFRTRDYDEIHVEKYILAGLLMKKYMKPIYITLMDPSNVVLKKSKKERNSEPVDKMEDIDSYKIEDYELNPPSKEEILYYSLCWVKKPSKYHFILYGRTLDDYNKLKEYLNENTFYCTINPNIYSVNISIMESFLHNLFLKDFDETTIEHLQHEAYCL